MNSGELFYVLLSTATVLFLLKKKKQEGRSEKTKEELLKIEEKQKVLAKEIQEESKSRDSLQKEMTEKTNEVLTPKEIADFFNDHKP